jgi:hypothetical protein
LQERYIPVSSLRIKMKKLGEILVEHNHIDQSQLEQALERQIEEFEPLGQILVGLGHIT